MDDIRQALDYTSGIACGDGYEVDFGGACPVQWYGIVDGHFCYYRARHDAWRIEFYADSTNVYEMTYEERHTKDVAPIYVKYDDIDNAGWLGSETSKRLIEEAISEFRAFKKLAVLS